MLSLPLTLVMIGGAMTRDGIGAAIFVLALGALVIALGAWLVHLATPGVWRRPVDLGVFFRTPGSVGVAIALVAVPLILLLREAGVFVALAALCLYPLLDAPRVAAHPSWWRAAIVSTFVWLIVFGMVAGASRPSWQWRCAACSWACRSR